jgi:hypothetical protein
LIRPGRATALRDLPLGAEQLSGVLTFRWDIVLPS